MASQRGKDQAIERSLGVVSIHIMNGAMGRCERVGSRESRTISVDSTTISILTCEGADGEENKNGMIIDVRESLRKWSVREAEKKKKVF